MPKFTKKGKASAQTISANKTIERSSENVKSDTEPKKIETKNGKASGTTAKRMRKNRNPRKIPKLPNKDQSTNISEKISPKDQDKLSDKSIRSTLAKKLKKVTSPVRCSLRSRPVVNYNVKLRFVNVKKQPRVSKKIKKAKKSTSNTETETKTPVKSRPTTQDKPGPSKKLTLSETLSAETASLLSNPTIPDDTPKAYQFNITMMYIEPLIWRRIEVPEEYHFGHLNFAVKSAMGWVSCHNVHGFWAENANGSRDFIKHPNEFDTNVIDERIVKLADRFKKKGDHVIYSYTFGEGWEHYIELEDIVPRVPNREYPRILAGKRACPTEDIGGIDGYLTLCEVLKNRKHPEREEYMDWLEDYGMVGYNPDRFNIREIEFVNCPIYKGKSKEVHHINKF